MKKIIPLLHLQFLLLLLILGLSGFLTTPIEAQTHYRDTTLNTAIGRPTGTLLGCIDSDILWTCNDGVWVNNDFPRLSSQGEVSTQGYIIFNDLNYIYGLTQGDAIMYTTNEGDTWEEVYTAGFPAGQSPQDVTCINDNEELRWITIGGTKVFEIVDEVLEEKLYLSGLNSICSNMSDTIYIARSNGNHRAYSVDDWVNYVEMPGGAFSIDWKDGQLMTVHAGAVMTRSTNSEDSWETIITLDNSGQWLYCTWLVGPSANQLDLAVGSATFDQIQVWREIVAPTPEFVADQLTGYDPLTIQFTDLSTGQPTEWFWDFGDGETSDEQNPTHTYDAAGSFTVSLTVSNGAGSNMMTKDDYIVVEWLPMDASFTATPESGTAPVTVQFTDQSSGNPTAWEWNFGDGGVSTLKNPEYTYFTPGTYTVALTVIGPGGEDTQEMVNLITVHYPLPVANFEADPTGGLTPLEVGFVNLSENGSSYHWEFGDGGTSTALSPEYVYENPGVYTVSLMVENPDGMMDEMVKEDYITVAEPAQVVITSFAGEPAGFVTKQPWSGNFTHENGESAEISSSLGNQYTLDFASGTVTSSTLSNTGEDILTLSLTGANGQDFQDLSVPVFASHNLLSDSIGSQNIQIYTSPTLATPETIEYELLFPMQDFYSLYNFTFAANNQGAGIQEIIFQPTANALSIHVQCNTSSNYQTFSIRQNESGTSWFQNGLLMLFPDEGTLALLSEDISNFVYPSEVISTKIFTGAATTWTITNETYNEVVYTGSHTATGITEKTINVGSWTLGPILEQSMRIDISSPIKTISRYFPMDGTTGMVDFGNETSADRLGEMYPNPFSGQTTIPFFISTPGKVKIELFNIKGSLIRVLLNENKQSGDHQIELEGASIPNGVYLVKLSTTNNVSIRQLVKF